MRGMVHLNASIIVGFVFDWLLQNKIEQAAQLAGYRVEWIGTTEHLEQKRLSEGEHQPGEYLFGQDGAMMERLVRWQPGLLIFDLDNEQIPWQKWIATLKSSPATRRIPILGISLQENGERWERGKSAGTDHLLPTSQLATLPQLIPQLARTSNKPAILTACAEPLPDLAWQGIHLFNQGHYFEAHEELEQAWMADRGAGRDLYRAILQIAVAYLQIQRQNYNGAVKMLLRVHQWIQPLPDICRGVNIDQLRQDVDRVYATLIELGAEQITRFDWSLARPVSIII